MGLLIKISIQYMIHLDYYCRSSIQKIVHSMSFVPEYSIIKIKHYSVNFSSKIASTILFDCIEFNKIFIQLENPGITQGKQNIGGMV